MRSLLLFFAVSGSFICIGQTIEHCKQRFLSYLNFRGSLNASVKFSSDAIYFVQGGKTVFAVFQEEIPALSAFFQQTNAKEQIRLISAKGRSRYSAASIDSLSELYSGEDRTVNAADLPLKGFRVAIDPGHFGTNLKDAEVEQKFLHFVRMGPHGNDTILIFESVLTFNTAGILKKLLEEKGAEVLLTRQQADHTSFGCDFQTWMKKHRRRVLDSLYREKQLPPAKYQAMVTATDQQFFREFFRDHELSHRAKLINAFRPHATAIIHYNVDEKNDPWQKHTGKNYTMAFIGGAFTATDLQKPESLAHFVRLLLSDQLNRSEKLAASAVQNFNSKLNVPVAKTCDATYLQQNCLAPGSQGVFSRNLALCRKVNSPLVYGESLYQDNEAECSELMKCNSDKFGIRTSDRIIKAAEAYFDAIFEFLTEK